MWEKFGLLYVRAVRRRRFFRLYIKRSLKRACQSAIIGFVSGLVIGFQTRQVITITLVIAALTALLHFLKDVFA